MRDSGGLVDGDPQHATLAATPKFDIDNFEAA
jgi:hypothetical protein